MSFYRSRHKGIRFNGAKGRCGEIVSIINELIPQNGVYAERFVGSGKVIQSITDCVRYGSDIDPNIILLLQAIQDGWNPPTSVSEEEYKYWFNRKDRQNDPMIGFIGYGCSFGARFFQGYARSRKGTVNFAASARRALLRQKPFMECVKLACHGYDSDCGPVSDVEYCDPPYGGTTPVGGMKPFNHKRFWTWACRQAQERIVLVSEYVCPVKAEVIWQKKVATGLRFGTGGDGSAKGDGTRKPEKLFLLGNRRPKSFGFFGVLSGSG